MNVDASATKPTTLLMGALLLALSGCAADDGNNPAASSAPLTVTTSVPTTAAVSTTAAPTAGLIMEDWVPVGGSEYHDSRDHAGSDNDVDLSDAMDHTSRRLRNLLAEIDEDKQFGRLHLGAIDRFWAEALDMLDDSIDSDPIAGVFDLLATEREEQLAHLPASMRDHVQTIRVALTDRDYEARAAAYTILDDLVTSADDLASDASMIYELHFQLEQSVKAEMLRRAALESGRIGPELDPQHLPELPDQILLVQWADEFYWAELVVLIELDGDPIGYLDGHTLRDSRAMTIAEGEVFYGAPLYGVHNDNVEGCVESFVSSDRSYLICDDTTSYRNPERRAEVRVQYPDGSTERLGGAGYSYAEEDPSNPVVGHWVSVLPSPDHSAVLGQWSGECELPSAHMIYEGEVSTGFGNENDSWPESWVLGWSDDGHGIVAVSGGACSGTPDRSGVFAWSPTGESTPIYLTGTGGVVAQLVRPNEPFPIPIVEIPRDNALDTRVYFDSYEFDVTEIGAGKVSVGTKDGNPLVAFFCEDSNVFVGPGLTADLEELLDRAEDLAARRGCRTTAGVVSRCLGEESDPDPCVE